MNEAHTSKPPVPTRKADSQNGSESVSASFHTLYFQPTLVGCPPSLSFVSPLVSLSLSLFFYPEFVDGEKLSMQFITI